MKIKFISFFMLLLSFSSSANIQDIQKQLNIPNLLECEFYQERYISAMNKPLISNGLILLDRTQGVIWQQNKPFEQLMVMTEKQIYQSVNGSQQTIKAEEQPQIFHFTKIMSNLFQGNWNAIDQYFKLDSKIESKNWQVNLLPNQSPFNQVFKKIELKGSNFVEEIHIFDQQNDQTHLKFEHCRPLKSLTNEQSNLFKN